MEMRKSSTIRIIWAFRPPVDSKYPLRLISPSFSSSFSVIHLTYNLDINVSEKHNLLAKRQGGKHMKLTVEGIRDRAGWEKAGIALPGYDVEKVSEKAKREPGWVHFGIGNIFRIFIGGIADGLLEEGVMDKGITCVETFDYDVVDKIYEPYDNLGLSVVLHGDGTREYKVLGSLAEAIKAQSSDPAQWKRLKEIFTSPSLQMVSFTITEKG